MNAQPEIRSARLGDAASACVLLRRSITECCAEDHRNDAGVLSAWLGNKTTETVAAWFLSPANFSIVAILDGQLAGVAILTRSGKIALCHVAPEARFQGVGTAMLQALEERAMEWRLPSLGVVSTKLAQSFYRRHGYTPSGISACIFSKEAAVLSKRLQKSYAKVKTCGACQEIAAAA
jgi:putative acetyltransferase